MSRGDAPSRAAPRSTSQKGAGEPVLELLVCRSCGSSFERVRTRGRKPTLCPSCRGPVSGREVP
jgi:predicted Zn-ribbon and HTH transcriptional regulator